MLKVPGEDRVLIHCVAFSLPVPLNAKTMMTIRSTRFRAMYKDYKILRDKAESINGRDWQTLQFMRAMAPKEAKRNPDGNNLLGEKFATL